MAKILKYKIQSGEELLDAAMECKTQAHYDINYPLAEKEAVGEIIVEGEFDPELVPTGEPVTWDELDAAYQAGYDAGYTEGVNGAYDQ